MRPMRSASGGGVVTSSPDPVHTSGYDPETGICWHFNNKSDIDAATVRLARVVTESARLHGSADAGLAPDGSGRRASMRPRKKHSAGWIPRMPQWPRRWLQCAISVPACR
jgi:hypothetical protein